MPKTSNFYSYLEEFIARGVNVAFDNGWEVVEIEQEGGGAGGAAEDEAILRNLKKRPKKYSEKKENLQLSFHWPKRKNKSQKKSQNNQMRR